MTGCEGSLVRVGDLRQKAQHHSTEGAPFSSGTWTLFAPGLTFPIGVVGLWSITSAKHQIADGGFTTSIETEKPKSEVS